MQHIVFIVDCIFYKWSFGKTSNNFVNYLTKSKEYDIKLFYTDEDTIYVQNKINELKPKMIINYLLLNYI